MVICGRICNRRVCRFNSGSKWTERCRFPRILLTVHRSGKAGRRTWAGWLRYNLTVTWDASQGLFTNIFSELSYVPKVFNVFNWCSQASTKYRIRSLLDYLLKMVLVVWNLAATFFILILITRRADFIWTMTTAGGLLDDRHSHRGLRGSRAWKVSLRNLVAG